LEKQFDEPEMPRFGAVFEWGRRAIRIFSFVTLNVRLHIGTGCLSIKRELVNILPVVLGRNAVGKLIG
jgi:hypothetical protein